MNTVSLAWILAVGLIIAGVVALSRRQVLWGVLLVIVGLVIGGGGSSILNG